MTDAVEAAREGLLGEFGYHSSYCGLGPSGRVYCDCEYPLAVKRFEAAIRADESALRAAAKPYEPSEAEVERVAATIESKLEWHDVFIGDLALDVARAALKAAWGDG